MTGSNSSASDSHNIYIVIEFALGHKKLDNAGIQKLSSILEQMNLNVFIQVLDKLLKEKWSHLDFKKSEIAPALIKIFKGMFAKAHSEEDKKIIFEKIIHILHTASFHYQDILLGSIIEAFSDWLPTVKSIPDHIIGNTVSVLIAKIKKDEFRAGELFQMFVKSCRDLITTEHLKNEIKILLDEMEQSSDNSDVPMDAASTLGRLRILADKIAPSQLKEIFNGLFKKWNNPGEDVNIRELTLDSWLYFSDLQNDFIVEKVKESIPYLIELTILIEPAEEFTHELQEKAIEALTKHVDLMSESQKDDFIVNLTRIIDEFSFYTSHTNSEKNKLETVRFETTIEAYLSLLKTNNPSIKTAIINKVIDSLQRKPEIVIHLVYILDKYLHPHVEDAQRKAVISELEKVAHQLGEHWVVKDVHDLIGRLNITPMHESTKHSETAPGPSISEQPAPA